MRKFLFILFLLIAFLETSIAQKVITGMVAGNDNKTKEGTVIVKRTNERQILKANEVNPSELETKFLQLCDVAVQKLKLPKRINASGKPEMAVGFCMDSYAVRALAVAYDLTGKEEYLSTIKTWADKMITFQEKMIPHGGYYMNYNRSPFQISGGWYNGDCGSIAMGVLATAVRCTNSMEKLRYINSVESYAKLVLENYVGDSGGITDGLWPKYDLEWYCSSATVGSMFFLLYNETNDQRYLNAGLNAVNWLSRLNLISPANKFIPKLELGKESSDSIIIPQTGFVTSCEMFYYLEPYSAGLPYILSKKYPEIEELALKRIALLMKWNSENLCGKGQSKAVKKYDAGWNVAKFGGIPFHIYVQTQIVDNDMRDIADRHLELVVSELLARDEQQLTETTVFTMMSMAERISPGSIYRKSRPMYETVQTK